MGMQHWIGVMGGKDPILATVWHSSSFLGVFALFGKPTNISGHTTFSRFIRHAKRLTQIVFRAARSHTVSTQGGQLESGAN